MAAFLRFAEEANVKEDAMRRISGAGLTGVRSGLVATVFLGLCGSNLALAQTPWSSQSTLPAAQPVKQSKPAEPPAPSQVFPNGEFPTGPPAPEGGVPASTVKQGPGPILSQTGKPQSADYGPQGYVPRYPQEAPGAPEFSPIIPPGTTSAEMYAPPALQTYDYFLPAVGPHAYADYAPPGFEARDTDEGQAPGVPEFTRITPPVPVSPDEAARFVTRGLAPGSFLVPGTNTSFRFRGFVRATGLYDTNPIGSRDDFVTNTIPVPQQSGQNYNISARYSRIGLDTWTPTPLFDWNMHTFIEADFFNGPAQAVGGGGNPFRLRFAFVDFGYFRIGQQNTVFMDGNAFPTTVDFAGPRGLVNQRRPGVRATIPLADNLFWAVGVEQPFSDITTNGLGTGFQDIPDFASHLRYEGDYGHVQLSTLARSIGYRPNVGDEDRRGAWGISGSTVFHPWAWCMGSNPLLKDNPNGLERSRILLQYTCGWGFGRYIQDTAGLGLDGQVDPVTGAFDTVYAAGWSASYEHWYTERWLTNVTYSEDLVGSTPNQPATTYAGAKYLTAGLWYIPFRNMSIGLENVWGERKNIDGERGRANRINGLVQYNF
jgi:hypothetical protein